MRTWKSLFVTLTIAGATWAPATASAAFEHVVSKGETLSSVAAADGLSISELADANGMSADSQLITGSTLVIPPQGAAGQTAAAAAAPQTSSGAAAPTESSSASGGYVVQRGDTLSGIAARLGVSVDSLAAANGLDPSALLIAGTALHSLGGSSSSSGQASAPATSGSSSSGGYTVQRGDTLSAIAARMGVSMQSLAAGNGLNPSHLLIAGTTLHITGALATSSAGTEADPNVAPAGSGAEPTGETVSSSEVGSIAAAEGVSPSLAEAVGYQESGFNNNEVSSTGAIGVMQIEPGTWNDIGSLSGQALSPDSATDNVRAGSLFLHSLLDQTGGDTQMALAGYYQGLQSVREHGVLPETRAYVNNVLALQGRFGG